MATLGHATGRLVVIGCGNLNRTDDGVGVIVAHRLKEWLHQTPIEGVGVCDAGTGGMEVMFQARGATSLIIVDACRSGSPAGTIFRVPGAEVVSRPVRGHSLHDFRWEHALHAGRQIFGDAFPEDITVYLVEAADLAFGVALTPVVKGAVEQVVSRLKGDIAGWVTTNRCESGVPME